MVSSHGVKTGEAAVPKSSAASKPVAASKSAAASKPVAASKSAAASKPVAASKSSSAIEKAFGVLSLLRDSPVPLTLSAIAEATGVAASSAHATLNHLLSLDAVVLTEHKRYTLGPVLHYLGAAYARGTPMYRAAWIEAVNVANELGVTAVSATAWDGRHLILNAHRGPGSDVAVPFGGGVPLAAASWGKTYYATTGEPLPEKLEAYTAHSIVDLGEFRDAVETTRTRGMRSTTRSTTPG
ncbi:helix-turn-helix domain-containing protein [Rhodococcus opacus]|nr:helix-turn-helix domain-containing protein [Rhodococcus opacus]